MMNIRMPVAGIILLMCSLAGCVSVPKNHTLPLDGRTIDGGREVQISVAQGEIKTNINQSNVSAAMGGGLLGALIDAGVEAHRAKVAEEAVKPLRDALIGYDFDSLVQEKTKATLSGISWFMPRDYSFVKEINAESRSKELSATVSHEMAFVDYDYGMAADFGSLELNCRVAIADKKIPPNSKPVARLNYDKLVYQQTYKVVVPLAHVSKEMNDNVSQWDANQAVLAKHALEEALALAQSLIQRGFDFSAGDQQRIEKEKSIVVNGYSGKLIEEDGNKTLLWSQFPVDQWVLVTKPVG